MGMFFFVLGVLEFVSGMAAGVWMALIGWFVISGAAGERAAATAQLLRGLAVHDVMVVPPVVAPAWLMLPGFVDHLGTERAAAQRVFPVVGFDGEPVGVLLARDLERVPPNLRATTRVREVARRTRPLVVAPDAPVADIVAPMRAHGGVAVGGEPRPARLA
jgi:CBS domain-containing protein